MINFATPKYGGPISPLVVPQISMTIDGIFFLMKARLTQATELRGAVVQEDLHSELTEIMEEKSSLVFESYPEGSFVRPFWESQRRAEGCSIHAVGSFNDPMVFVSPPSLQFKS